MKLNWSWLLLVAVLVVVAYKAGQMNDGFSGAPSPTKLTIMMWIFIIVGLIILSAIYYGIIAPGGYLINRAGHSMYNGIIKR